MPIRSAIWKVSPQPQPLVESLLTNEKRLADMLMLDPRILEWFTKQGYSSKDSESGLIYVNSGNSLEQFKTSDDTWKVRFIEEDFHRSIEMEGS